MATRIITGLIASLFFISHLAFAATKLQPLTVVLDWFPNPNHAPLFVAKQQGYFKQQGLDVKLVGPADPSDPPKLVAAGKADIAITYEPYYFAYRKQGLPLVRIATLIATPLNCVTVLAGSHIKTMADLKGKKIAYSTGGANKSILAAMLKHNGLSLKDVTLVNVHYNLVQALLSRKVDAISGAMRNFEPLEIQLAGKKVRNFYPEDNGVPNYEELILVTNKKEVNDPRIAKFLIAMQKGVLYLIDHPQKTWLQFAKNHPELNNPLNKQAWFATLPRFALRPTAVDAASYQRFEEFLQGK